MPVSKPGLIVNRGRYHVFVFQAAFFVRSQIEHMPLYRISLKVYGLGSHVIVFALAFDRAFRAIECDVVS